MRRREFIAGLIGSGILPSAALAQRTSMPVVGVLHSGSTDAFFGKDFEAFRQGLADLGLVEDRNFTFEFRIADNHLDRLPELAMELVNLPVSVIFSGSNVAPTLAARAATKTIPIVFFMGADPVATGVVESLSNPGANITGVTILAGELFGKRLELLHELVPTAAQVGYLINPANPAFSDDALKRQSALAKNRQLELLILNSASSAETDRAFATFAARGADAVMLAPDTAYQSQISQIVALAAQYAIPTSYPGRDYVDSGGLISYGANFPDVYRRIGSYVGRILKGEAPRDLPVQQPTGFQLVLNLRAAKRIGLSISPSLLARADEVIE